MKDINIEQLIMLVALLFMIYFFMNIKETFDQLKEDKTTKTKDCSQRSINAAYNDYIFGGVKSNF